MSTTNVKILLRRGLRKDISHDTLVPGEMGFTVDTNQLYIGIENAKLISPKYLAFINSISLK